MGRRLSAEQSLSFGIVQGICDNAELLSMAAKMLLQILGKEAPDRDHLSTLKCDLYRETLEVFGNIERIVVDRQKHKKFDMATSKLWSWTIISIKPRTILFMEKNVRELENDP